MNFTILNYDALESTNDEALNQAKRGADEGLCIVARQQTRGRGRYGRVWSSPPDAGIYFSLVLRPKIEMRFLPLITLMSAVAVHDALEEIYDLDCDIKWVNDIHIKSKKICGILAETADTPRGLAVIVGIGINLNSQNFPPEISDVATSIAAEIGKIPESEILLAVLTKKLSHFYQVLNAPNGTSQIRADWTQRSSYAEGKQIKVSLNDEMFKGVSRGIEENGALRVEIESGEIKIVHAGDVQRLREN